MILDKVLFLSAYSERSLAYANAMLSKNVMPACTLLFGKEKANHLGKLENVVSDFDSKIVNIEADDVNDDSVFREIIKYKPKLIIYSGYGGQIVGKNILQTNIPVLHIHGGWLPDYRGSTTIYYSLLKEHRCGASAILLSSKIDSGIIVKRKKYPAPKRGTDIDYVYDNEIRADLLIEVLAEWNEQKGFAQAIKQDDNEGVMYYVIHPVLKHVAILSL